MHTSKLDLDEIQGDVLTGMQKDAELFLFFRIVDSNRFKYLARGSVIGRVVTARRVQERKRIATQRLHRGAREPWLGLNLGFTKDGMTELLGPRRPPMERAFERGAAHPDTIARLNDPPPATWVEDYRSDRIDGVFLIGV